MLKMIPGTTGGSSRYLARVRVARDRVNNPLLYYPHGFLEIAVNAFYKIAQHLDTIDDQIKSAPLLVIVILTSSACRFLPINRIVDFVRCISIDYIILHIIVI